MDKKRIEELAAQNAAGVLISRYAIGEMIQALQEAALARRPDSGKVAEAFMDLIGPDPLKAPREDDPTAASVARLRAAYVKQQPLPVPDQMAIVWRVDLGRMYSDLIRFKSCFENGVTAPATDSAATEQAGYQQTILEKTVLDEVKRRLSGMISNGGIYQQGYKWVQEMIGIVEGTMQPAKRSDSAAEPDDQANMGLALLGSGAKIENKRWVFTSDQVRSFWLSAKHAAPASADVGELPLSDKNKAFSDEARTELQRIFDSPANDIEKAFRDGPLSEGSQPKDWYDSLPPLAWYGFSQFKKGWAAGQASSAALPKENAGPDASLETSEDEAQPYPAQGAKPC